MPDQAFSTISSMAGPEQPARHQTLNHFLNATTATPFHRAEVIRAVESHNELFALCLGSVQSSDGSLVNWHTALSDETFCDLALTAANQELGQSSGSSHLGWQRTRLAQTLVDSFARLLSYAEIDRHRLVLLAGLSDLGHQQVGYSEQPLTKDELLKLELEQFSTTGAEVAAEFMASRGFSRKDCDVLRYQYEGVATLQDAETDLLLVAFAGRVADALLSDFVMPDDYVELVTRRSRLDIAAIYNASEQAYMAFRVENDEVLNSQNFSRRLSLANLAQQFRGATSLEGLLESGSSSFSLTEIYLAHHKDGLLYLEAHGDEFEVSTSQEASVLAQAYRDQSAFSAEGNALVAIVDKQILSRMAANVLWLLPTPDGVAVCGLGDTNRLEASDEFLKASFHRALGRWLAESDATDQPMIELGEVQRRIRELNHEVNNPLAIVQNYLKTLSLRLGDNNDAQRDIKTIADEMLRIGVIVQKYAEIGSDPVAPGMLDINDLIRKQSSLVSGAHPQLRVTLDLEDDLPELALPEAEFTQVLVNLLKNAVEALQDSRSPEILLATGQANVNGRHFVEVVVEDNGPGIPDHIYRNLFTANNSSKGDGHSGIGLSIIHRLVMEMGGYVSCRSGEAGCQFQILLPIPFEQEQQ